MTGPKSAFCAPTRGLIAACLLPLALAGCISVGGGGKPPAQLYSLTTEAPIAPGTTITARAAETLLVLEPDTDHALAVARVPVTLNDTAIAYLTGFTWVDRPARLFRSLLIDTIRARGKLLVLDETQSQFHLRLEGKLVALSYDAQAHAVVVQFDALRRAADGAITQHRFEAREAGVAPVASAIAPALNRAANDVARQVADWVG